MGATLLAVILTAVLSASASNISEQCQVHNERRITCSCIGNEELFLPENYNYTRITNVSVTGCIRANFHYNSLWKASNIEEIIIQNIEDYLDFDVSIESNNMKLLKLSNIGRIPLIASHTFTNLKTIDTFTIENALIENFEEDFNFVNVSHFILTNVVIKHINKLNFSEKSTTLRIVNSKFRNVTSFLNFANFRNVDIIDSMLELYTPGVVSIQGDTTVVRNSSFSNVSMSLVAAESITISGICADGKSTLRVLSKSINSTNNRMPNEITYRNDNQPKVLIKKNNIVCKAGNCDCPKSSGQAQSRTIVLTLIVGCLLTASLSRSFFYLFYDYNIL
ncbi:hypothetical protein DMN91_006897 [Ooceraea biroi]|uniref:Uncharacterized protein n=1 Tax=Ooceraea biroi TaxID=2015173 RepID=A0A026WM17_OOCBI|nr:uncharacterized protein LOC105277526 [Ooceraea biroi]XP_011334225.1 uncharacterized protein LOC105277526 [Ooceraea biroi]XP_011334226.1 uncharacterized protein LOC105277526 [Ooceraea biroi]EZA57008.1 hypothetical protein X777_01614 [Ooceraea biroi]RLU20290.1 hypothetical protein DMN91_006897 [Ooceraea biroi]